MTRYVLMGSGGARPPGSTSVPSRRPVLPVVLALVGGVSALAFAAWLPSHLTGEHRLGPRLQSGEVTWWIVVGVLLAQSVLIIGVPRFPAGALLLVTGLPLVLVLAPAPPLGLYTLTAIAEMTGSCWPP